MADAAPSPAERRVLDAAVAGEIADLGGAGFDPRHGGSWSPDQEVRADWLRSLLCDSDGPTLDARGVWVRGAVVTGQVDWRYSRLRAPLVLERCRFVEPDVALSYASGTSIGLIECSLSRLYAPGLTLEGDLDVLRCRADEVELYGARIGGRLRLSGSHLGTPAEGDVEPGATGRAVLRAGEIQAERDVLLDEGFTAEGAVSLPGARIGGQLACSGGVLRNPGGIALFADSITARLGVFLPDFHAAGEVRLLSANILTLQCSGSTIENPGGDALTLDGSLVATTIVVRGTRVAGRVTLRGVAAIAFDGSRSTFSGGTTVISADGSYVKGAVFLRDAVVEGEVRLHDVTVQIVDCDRARFSSPTGTGLNLTRAVIPGGVYLRNVALTASVDLPGARIGPFELISAAVSADSFALYGPGAQVTGAMRLRDLELTGRISLLDAHVDGSLVFDDCTWSGAPGDLDLEGSVVKGALVWTGVHNVATLNLSGADVGELEDDAASWPAPGGLLLAGFRYGRLSDRAPTRPEERLDWIGRQPKYLPQPYEQLARVYRAGGHDEAARLVQIEKFEMRRKAGDLPRVRRAASWVLGRAIGHGYRPGRLVLALLALYAAVLAAVAVAASNDGFVPVRAAAGTAHRSSDCTGGYPCLSPWAYALETVVPILNLRQQDYWQANAAQRMGRPFRALLFAGNVLGWAATTLAVAAFTGLARRE